MKRSIQPKYFLVLIYLLLTACSGLNRLPKGQKLYTGASVKLETSDKVNKKSITAIASAALLPAPNKSFLGMRSKLWKYETAGDDPKTGIKKWMKRTGDAPVLISNVKPEVTAKIIDARMFNIGIFNSHTEFKIVEYKHTAKVIYTSHIQKPFTIKAITYSITDDSLKHTILSEQDKSLIKPGIDYNLDLLKTERIRIDALLKNKGYFYFNPDYLVFKADTSGADHTISFRLSLKDSVPKNALTVYRINNVFINQDYSLEEEVADTMKSTFRYQGNTFMGKENEMNIRPAVILRSVYLKKNEIYSRLNHTITLNRLMSMGNFKFVQLKFSDSDTTAPGYLDATILMTTMPNHTFGAEMDLISKSNNYTGPRLNISFLNRNTFSGAELLNVHMAGSFEAQLSGNQKNLYSYSLNPQVELSFPRFITPFNLRRTNSIYIPKTVFSISYNYLKRVNYFDMRTFQFTYGFRWKENIRKEHELNPISVSYTSLTNQSQTFQKLLDSLPFLKKSYEEQFIAGGNYSFTYNEQVSPGKKMQYYLHLTAETAGNMFSLVKAISGQKPASDNPARVIGSIYSQFAKASVDARGYYNFSEQNKLAFRFFAGVAMPFGNSAIIPYSRQFFSGGPNSIRAFQINSVGPGTFYQDISTRGLLQLGGDIKLELNGEYRFNIYRFLKGAMFVDAGNVWLEKSSPANTGSPFMFSTFTKQLAVGAGVGLRVDVSFFILRFDLATPLRKPWLTDHNWVINQIDFGNSRWRKDNLILNIAIGYPF